MLKTKAINISIETGKPIFFATLRASFSFSKGPSLPGIIGTMQANEVIKTILNVRDDLLGKMIVFNSLKPEFRKIKLSKNPQCINKCVKQND